MTPEDRAWEVVRRAYEERSPTPRRRSTRLALAATAAAVAAVVVAALSPPGQAVFKSVREAVGHRARRAGALLAASARAAARRVGRRRRRLARALQRLPAEARPVFRRRVVAARALRHRDRAGTSSSRSIRTAVCAGSSRGRDPSWPRWEGTMTDTRIAYIAASGLRVVAGDGTGDHLLDAYAGDVPPAWDPARLHTLAYYSGGAIVLRGPTDGSFGARRSRSLLPRSSGRRTAATSPSSRRRRSS